MLRLSPLLVTLLALAAPRVPAQEPVALDEAGKQHLREFTQAVEQATAAYAPVQEANAALLEAGDLAGATRRLLEAVPEAERTPAHDFVLGNALFSLEPDVSRRLHERALAADPDNILILNEWALHLQRDGRWAEAEAAWARLLAHPAFQDPTVAALRAEALLHLGRHAEALAAWRLLDVRRRHAEIEETLGWAHAPLSPAARRAELLPAAVAGDAAAARDLVLLDLHADSDWWKVESLEDDLEADLVRLEDAFGADDRGLQELRALALLERAVPDEPRPGARPRGGEREAAHLEAARERLAELGLLGAEARLAQDPVVAERLLELLPRAGLASAEELLALHGDALRARAGSAAGDVAALRTLCALLERTRSGELAALDRLGWDRYREPGCAARLVAAAQARGEPDEALLADALARFPGDAALLRQALKQDLLAGRATPPERLAALILASLEGLPDARELDLMFVKLDQALQGAAK